MDTYESIDNIASSCHGHSNWSNNNHLNDPIYPKQIKEVISRSFNCYLFFHSLIIKKNWDQLLEIISTKIGGKENMVFKMII